MLINCYFQPYVGFYYECACDLLFVCVLHVGFNIASAIVRSKCVLLAVDFIDLFIVDVVCDFLVI